MKAKRASLSVSLHVIMLVTPSSEAMLKLVVSKCDKETKKRKSDEICISSGVRGVVAKLKDGLVLVLVAECRK